MKYQLAALIATGLTLAQMNSYNGGIPITPGTGVPESKTRRPSHHRRDLPYRAARLRTRRRSVLIRV